MTGIRADRPLRRRAPSNLRPVDYRFDTLFELLGIPPGFPALAADRGPLPAGARLQVQRPELVHAEDDFRVAVSRSTIAYSCSTRAFFSWYLGSFEDFQVFSL